MVGNPDGFKTKHAVSLREIRMQLDISSLATDIIRIKELTLIQPEITYEYATGGSNLDVLQRHIVRSISQQRSKRQNAPGSEPSQKLVIEDLYIKDGTASVSASALNGTVVSIPIPDLHLHDIGKKSNGATAGEAAQQVLNTMTHQITHSVAPLSVRSAGKTIQNGMDATTRTIKDLFQ